MGNLFDYLREHGDTSFDEAPLSEADNLVLCQLAYCDLARVVPRIAEGRSVTVAQAWHAYEQLHGSRAHRRKTERLFRAMAGTRRFGHVRLSALEEQFCSVTHRQFAAFTALLPDGTAYVAFRGTGRHISGWRENFMMSYRVVDAQRDAQRYLDAIACMTSGGIHVGGHSKGGNLAAYAAAFCEPSTRERILAVWCNDPPGFMRGVVDFEAFGEIAGRMYLFVPEFCVVANIMEQVVQPVVIRSESRRYLQHDALTWQIEAGRFARVASVAPESRRIRRAFNEFIYTHNRAERIGIVNDLFDAVSLAGIETIGDFARGGLRTAERILAQFSACHEKTRTAVRDLLLSLAAERATSLLVPLR